VYIRKKAKENIFNTKPLISKQKCRCTKCTFGTRSIIAGAQNVPILYKNIGDVGKFERHLNIFIYLPTFK